MRDWLQFLSLQIYLKDSTFFAKTSKKINIKFKMGIHLRLYAL